MKKRILSRLFPALACLCGLAGMGFMSSAAVAAPHTTRLKRNRPVLKKAKKLTPAQKAKMEKEIARNLKLLMHMKMLKRLPMYRYLGLIEQFPPRQRTRMVVHIRRSPPRWGSFRRPSRKQRN